MGYTADEYLNSIKELVETKGELPKDLAHRILATLAANQDHDKLEAIIQGLEEHGLSVKIDHQSPEIIFAKDEADNEQIIKALLSLGVNKDDLIVSVDESLVGGFILKYKDYVLDFSVKNKLSQLKKQLLT